ncbi:MAG: tetratricopeptide repeat protein [Lachnospiraceae bacterium]|nr:tetratricopeptide repeat protein [Lachnospiraceae bacterium]
MKFQKHMVIVLGLLLALGMTGCKSKEKENQEAYRKVGINSMAKGDYDKAIQSFQKALDMSLGKIGEEELDICYYKAAAQFAKGDYDSAIETYTALIEYDEKNAQAYYLRGSVYLHMEKEEQALKDYTKAVETGSTNYEVYEGIYENLLEKGQEEEAREYLEKALNIKPKEAADYAMQGHIYYLLDDYRQAKSSLDKAIDKNDKTALLYLAEVYQAEDKTKESQALLENYVKDNEKDSDALNKLGLMQMNEKNYEEALKYFQLGLKIKDDPNRQELLKNEIIAYEYMKDFSTAKEKMGAYLEEYPEDEEAVREYTFLKTR